MGESIEMKEYMDAKECGEMIGRSAGAIRNLVLRRAIPYRKPGGRLIFLRSEIKRWVETSEGLALKDMTGES